MGFRLVPTSMTAFFVFHFWPYYPTLQRGLSAMAELLVTTCFIMIILIVIGS